MKIKFTIKNWNSLELLTLETIKLLGSTENKIIKDKSGENVPLEITEVVLVHRDIVNNDYQQDSRVLYTFVPNKPFGSLLKISPTNHIFLKTYNSEYDEIKVGFTDQNTQPLEIEDRINLAMVIKWKNTCLKRFHLTCLKTLVALQRIKMRYSVEPRDIIYVKGYGFLSLLETWGKF